MKDHFLYRILSNLKEDTDYNVALDDVYLKYSQSETKPLGKSSFGKVLYKLFPNVCIQNIRGKNGNWEKRYPVYKSECSIVILRMRVGKRAWVK